MFEMELGKLKKEELFLLDLLESVGLTKRESMRLQAIQELIAKIENEKPN